MTRIRAVVPKDQAEAVIRALRTSQRVIAADLAYSNRHQPRSDRLDPRSAQIAEITNLLDQLSHGENEDRKVTGELEPLRTAACDALVAASEQLAASLHRYWHYNASLHAVERQLSAMQEGTALLRTLEAAKTTAASQPPTLM